jgi:LETM1-like protein
MTERRNQAAEKLLYILPKYLYLLEKDENVDKSDKESVRQLKHVLRSESALPTDLLQFRNLFTNYAQFKYFEPSVLLHIAHFMSLNPVTGVNTLNNILRIFKVKIPIDAPVIKYLTKIILTRELNLYFSRLRSEDELMSFEHVERFTEEELNTSCYRRGIEI